jgi:hypothetical protein
MENKLFKVEVCDHIQNPKENGPFEEVLKEEQFDTLFEAVHFCEKFLESKHENVRGHLRLYVKSSYGVRRTGVLAPWTRIPLW